MSKQLQFKESDTLWLEGDFAKALSVLDSIIRSETNPAGEISLIGGKALLLRAERKLTSGEVLEALGDLNQAREVIEPKVDESALIRGRIAALIGALYMAQNMPKEAEFFFESALKRSLSPEQEDVFPLLGHLLTWGAEKYISAPVVEQLMAAVSHTSKLNIRLFQKGIIRAVSWGKVNNLIPQARTLLEDLLGALPEKTMERQIAEDLLKGLGGTEDNQQSQEDHEALYEQTLADAALDQGHWIDAKRHIENALSYQPSPPLKTQLQRSLGAALVGLGEFDQAFNVLVEAHEYLESLPKTEPSVMGDVAHNLGLLEAQKGNKAGAELLLQQAFRARKKAFGDEHPLTIETTRAMKMVAAIAEKEPPLKKEEVVTIINHALAAVESSSYEEAKHLLQEAIDRIDVD